jgi:hypothetical protein
MYKEAHRHSTPPPMLVQKSYLIVSSSQEIISTIPHLFAITVQLMALPYLISQGSSWLATPALSGRHLWRAPSSGQAHALEPP